MRKGGGKAKGSEFERKVAKELSLWISNGQTQDLLWRTTLSGGRFSTGKSTEGAGDLSALGTSELSKQFSKTICVECKTYQEVSLTKAFLNDKADLIKWWNQVSGEAIKANLVPMLIAKGNRQSTIIIFPIVVHNILGMLGNILEHIIISNFLIGNVVIYKYDDFIEFVKWNEFYPYVRNCGVKSEVKRKSPNVIR